MSIAWFALLSFGALLPAYLLLAGSLSWTESVAGVAAAGVSAGFMTIERLRGARGVMLPVPPGRWAASVLASLVTDTWRVGAALVGALAGGMSGAESWQAFRPGGVRSSDAGRRALVTLATSLAPNGFVLDVRPSALPEAEHGLLLHRLAPASPVSGADWPA